MRQLVQTRRALKAAGRSLQAHLQRAAAAAKAKPPRPGAVPEPPCRAADLAQLMQVYSSHMQLFLADLADALRRLPDPACVPQRGAAACAGSAPQQLQGHKRFMQQHGMRHCLQLLRQRRASGNVRAGGVHCLHAVHDGCVEAAAGSSAHASWDSRGHSGGPEKATRAPQ